MPTDSGICKVPCYYTERCHVHRTMHAPHGSEKGWYIGSHSHHRDSANTEEQLQSRYDTVQTNYHVRLWDRERNHAVYLFAEGRHFGPNRTFFSCKTFGYGIGKGIFKLISSGTMICLVFFATEEGPFGR